MTEERKGFLYDMLLADDKEAYIEAGKKLAPDTPIEVLKEMADEAFPSEKTLNTAR